MRAGIPSPSSSPTSSGCEVQGTAAGFYRSTVHSGRRTEFRRCIMDGMRILIVEDDRKLAAFLAKGLREEQYAVDVCGDGEAALECVAVNSYDLVILDIMLPRRNGFAVCEEMRRQQIFTPVIMLTARDAVEDRIHGLTGGADDYLVKPFSFGELLARIKAQLRRSQEYKTSLLQAGDLELDPFRRAVTRGGRRLELTGKEYALLEYLLRNKGRTVTQTMIIEHVWDMNYEGMSNIVNVYINHLRKKVDDGSAVRLIQTIRGQGYRINEDPAS